MRTGVSGPETQFTHLFKLVCRDRTATAPLERGPPGGRTGTVARRSVRSCGPRGDGLALRARPTHSLPAVAEAATPPILLRTKRLPRGSGRGLQFLPGRACRTAGAAASSTRRASWCRRRGRSSAAAPAAGAARSRRFAPRLASASCRLPLLLSPVLDEGKPRQDRPLTQLGGWAGGV